MRSQEKSQFPLIRWGHFSRSASSLAREVAYRAEPERAQALLSCSAGEGLGEGAVFSRRSPGLARHHLPVHLDGPPGDARVGEPLENPRPPPPSEVVPELRVGRQPAQRRRERLWI